MRNVNLAPPSSTSVMHSPSHFRQPPFFVQPPTWQSIYVGPNTAKVGKHRNIPSIKHLPSRSKSQSKLKSHHVPTNQHHCPLHLFPLRLLCNCPPCPSKTASQALSTIRNNLIRSRRDRRIPTDPDQHHPRRPFTLFHSRGRRSRRPSHNPIRPQRPARRPSRHYFRP